MTPTVFLTIPNKVQPFSIMIIAPSIKPDWKILGSGEGKMLSLQGMCMLRIYLLVQKDLGLIIRETGTALS